MSGRTLAEQAVEHVLKRMQEDPRFAWHIGAQTETYRLLTDAAAPLYDMEASSFRRLFDPTVARSGAA